MSRLSLGFAMTTLLLLSATAPSHAQRAMAHPIPRLTAAKPGAAPHQPSSAPAAGRAAGHG